MGVMRTALFVTTSRQRRPSGTTEIIQSQRLLDMLGEPGRKWERILNAESKPNTVASASGASSLKPPSARTLADSLPPSAIQDIRLPPGLLASVIGINQSFQRQIEQIVSVLDIPLMQANMARSIQGLFANTLSRQSDFALTEAEPSTYSSELQSAASYFERDELVITSFKDLQNALTDITEKHAEIPMVWRGAQDASWGLHSSLYRALMRINGVRPPSAKPKGAQPYPSEDEMVRAEERILQVAREEWRMDGTPALEVFARLQHYGAPTRLIDVTRNPYIAAWFAVEDDHQLNGKDARLFSIATKPVSKLDLEEQSTGLTLDGLGSLRQPFWHLLRNQEDRQAADWGTGAKRRIWIPPAYEQRIVAQNAGFIVDGVPMINAKVSRYFKKNSGNESWKKADLLASASLYVKTAKPTRKVRSNQHNFAPTFTFRIEASAKREIRDVLEKRYFYNRSTIYPDIAALASHLRTNLGDVLAEHH
jgi:hypothetical protein